MKFALEQQGGGGRCLLSKDLSSVPRGRGWKGVVGRIPLGGEVDEIS